MPIPKETSPAAINKTPLSRSFQAVPQKMREPPLRKKNKKSSQPTGNDSNSGFFAKTRAKTR